MRFIKTHKKTEITRTLIVEFTIETGSAKIRDIDVKDEKTDEKLPIWAGIVPIKQIATYPIGDKLLSDDIKIPKHVLDYYEKNKG